MGNIWAYLGVQTFFSSHTVHCFIDSRLKNIFLPWMLVSLFSPLHYFVVAQGTGIEGTCDGDSCDKGTFELKLLLILGPLKNFFHMLNEKHASNFLIFGWNMLDKCVKS